MSGKSLIGKSIPRVDSLRKATGAAKYTADLHFPRMLYAKVLRSPYAHARILKIDTSKAEELPGVGAVITGADTNGVKWGVFPYTQDHDMIPRDKVRFIGEEVAAVAAETEEIAERALELIDVEFEELEPVFDPQEAMKPESPHIHEDRGTNVNVHVKIDVGDVDEAFERAVVVLEDNFTSRGETYAMMEPYTVVADYNSEGFLDLWIPNAGPHVRAKALSNLLAIPLNKVRVRKIDIGGAFGGRSEVSPSDMVAALLSIKSRRPVKLVLSREETFTATRQVHDMIVHLRTGADENGLITARDVKVIYDGGAYSSTGPIATSVPFYVYEETYKHPNVRYNGYRVYTNKCPRGMYAHHGRAYQVAMTTHMDIIAEKLKLDPMEIRLRNALRSGDHTATDSVISSCGLSESIMRTAEMSGWRKKHGKLPRYRGIGMGSMGIMCGFPMGFRSGATAFARMNESGQVTVFSGIVDNGQGNENMAVQITAEVIGIPVEMINLVNTDTELTGHDPGAYSQAATFVGGNAVMRAAQDVRRQVLGAAAELMKTEPDDLDIDDGMIYMKESPERSFFIARAARFAMSRGGNIVGKGSYFPKISTDREWVKNPRGQMAGTYSYNTVVLEIEVDPATGKIHIINVWAAHDCGRPINPATVEGQIQGIVSRGGVATLMEELEWSDGQLLNPNLLDYKVPLATDMPEIDIELITTDDPEGPFGAKEGGLTCSMNVYKAIASAFHDATGVWLKELPFTPARVLKALSTMDGN